MRYFIYFSYDGTRYHGWQLQPNALSVQQCLDESLSTLLRRKVPTVGAGRTDAGVHAAEMVAHFDYELSEGEIGGIDCGRLTDKLNRILPADIAVKRIVPVRSDAHARFGALARTYRYRIYQGKQPFLRHYAVSLGYKLDFERMNEAAARLLHVSDFTSFSKLHTDVKTNVCRVTHARWTYDEGEDVWTFEITADRFLRNMVRAVVGTLIDVGRGRLSLDEFSAVIARKDRCAAGESMPARALSLVKIAYPAEYFI